MTIEQQYEAGFAPATMRLACPYDGCGGELVPTLEYAGGYSEHRDWTGTECDGCCAEWEKDGTPRKGPHRPTLAFRAEHRAREAAASTEQAQEKP